MDSIKHTEEYEKLMAMKQMGTKRWDQHLVLTLMNDTTDQIATRVFSAFEVSELLGSER